jgi:hypothetical protein
VSEGIIPHSVKDVPEGTRYACFLISLSTEGYKGR